MNDFFQILSTVNVSIITGKEMKSQIPVNNQAKTHQRYTPKFTWVQNLHSRPQAPPSVQEQPGQSPVADSNIHTCSSLSLWESPECLSTQEALVYPSSQQFCFWAMYKLSKD